MTEDETAERADGGVEEPGGEGTVPAAEPGGDEPENHKADPVQDIENRSHEFRIPQTDKYDITLGT